MAGLVVKVDADTKGLEKGLDKADSSVQGFGKSIGGANLTKLAAFAGGVGLAVAAVAELTIAASKDRDEQAKLETSIRAAGAAVGDWNTKVDEAIEKGQALAFSDSETREALEPLIRVTGSVAEATDKLALAQDVARAAGVPLATAADAVAKATAGSGRALAALLPGIDAAADSTDILAEAQRLSADQAKTFAASNAGASARLQDGFGELSETLGSVFLPALDALLPPTLEILKVFGELLREVLPFLVPVFKGLAAAISAVAKIVLELLGHLRNLIDLAKKAADAVGGIGNFIGDLNPFASSASAGSFSSSPTAFGAVPAARAAPVPAGITINISGDALSIERAVVQALRTYSRRNGVTIAGLT